MDAESKKRTGESLVGCLGVRIRIGNNALFDSIDYKRSIEI